MSDLLFSIGADDREFQRALGRIAKSSDSTASTVAKIFGFGSAVAIGKRLIGEAQSSIEAYAQTSDEARRRVEGMVAPWKAVQVAIGETLVGYVEPLLAKMGELGKIGTYKEIARQQDFVKRAMEGQHKLIFGLMADTAAAGGNAFDANRLRAQLDHEARMKEIGTAEGVGNPMKARMRQWEDTRYYLQDRSNDLAERLAAHRERVSDRTRMRFSTLELSSVGDRATRNQILGTNPNRQDVEGEILKEQRELKAYAKQQFDALVQIGANTKVKGAATYAP